MKLELDLDVNEIHARVRSRMIIGSIPRAIHNMNVRQARDWDTPPVVPTVRHNDSAATCASKLIEQSLFSATLTAKTMRAHFPPMAVVGRHNLLLIDDSVFDLLIGIHE